MYEIKVLGLEEVREAVEVMLREVTKKADDPCSIAVMDDRAELIYLVRMDGANGLSVDMAIKKAYTSARRGQNTRTVGERFQRFHWTIREYGPNYTIIPGGVAITKPGDEEAKYGGIGVAGLMPAEEDEALALVGLAAIQNILWPSKSGARE